MTNQGASAPCGSLPGICIYLEMEEIMFAIGDKIVYPMHGAGIIERIEDKNILGETRQYYVVSVSGTDMQIMVPVDSCDVVGVRGIISEEKLKDVLATLSGESTPMPGNWNRRYRENMEKLKTGDVLQVAEVVRNLMRTDRVKKLSTGEKKLLLNARQILQSEIVLVKGIDSDEAEKLVEETV